MMLCGRVGSKASLTGERQAATLIRAFFLVLVPGLRASGSQTQGRTVTSDMGKGESWVQETET